MGYHPGILRLEHIYCSNNQENNQYALILRYFFTKAFASSITGTLAAQALLKGVGVGDESATVMAATLTWILKGSLSLSF